MNESHCLDDSFAINDQAYEYLRKIVSIPRNIPRHIREDIAEIIFQELRMKKSYEIKDAKSFIREYGVFYPIFIKLKNTNAWEDIKQIAGKNETIAFMCLNQVLELVYDLIENFEDNNSKMQNNLNEDMQQIAKTFEDIVKETMDLWNRDLRYSHEQIEVEFPEEFIDDIREKSLDTQSDSSDYIKENALDQEDSLRENFDDIIDENNADEHPDDIGNNEREDTKENVLDLEDSLHEILDDFVDENDASEFPNELIDQQINQPLSSLPNHQNEGIQEPSVDFEDIIHKKIVDFMDKDNGNGFLNSLIDQQIGQPLYSFIDGMKDHLDSLDLLDSIFPGRMWNYSLRELHKEYIENLEKYASVVKNSKELKDIVETIGRIELEYGSKRISISKNGKSEMHSIHYSNNIEHMLPMEVMKLKNPVLKKKFYADMLENKLLTYQLRGKNWVSGPPVKKRKGPVVALVDTSGSMHGAPEILAKSTILAISKIMLKEKRDVKVILFSSVGQTTDIELTSKKKMAKEFMDFIQCSFGGGTDFNIALESGLKSLNEEEFKGADILFITDGLSSISNKSIVEEWKSLKETQDAKIYSLVIGNNNLGGLEEISDVSYIVQNANNWSMSESPAKFVKYIQSCY